MITLKRVNTELHKANKTVRNYINQEIHKICLKHNTRFIAGNGTWIMQFYLPLTDGDIITIDLQDYMSEDVFPSQSGRSSFIRDFTASRFKSCITSRHTDEDEGILIAPEEMEKLLSCWEDLHRFRNEAMNLEHDWKNISNYLIPGSNDVNYSTRIDS